MLTHDILKKEYASKKKEVARRLKEFSDNARKMKDDERFVELCFCICTPQSKAIKVAQVINRDNASKLLNMDEQQLAGLLRKNTRFHNNKARHIINARSYMKEISALDKDPNVAREFLVKNIKGLGYKEASHFLRNIGYRDICIVDRHVISLMSDIGVLDKTMPTTPKRYLEMEKKIKDYAKAKSYDVDELDLVLWSIKTGFVFR